MLPIKLSDLKEYQINNFWAKVSKGNNNDCWNWTGATRRRGYGHFYSFVSTRVAYFLHYGVDPMENEVLHSCDNPSCCNPNHLSLGDKKKNADEMMERGRGKEQFEAGSKHPGAILVESDIVEIKRRVNTGESQCSVARSYGIYQSVISRIMNKKAWSHVN